MKVILSTETELQIASYARLTETQLQVAFIGNATYDGLVSQLTPEALQELRCYADDTTYEVFTGYTDIVNPITVATATDGTLDIAVTFKAPTALELEVRALRAEVTALQAQINPTA